MKWWSDCTANWREKWGKVRNERNKARDEAKQLRASLETAIKESNSYKREKNELETQITQLKIEKDKIHMMLMKYAGQMIVNPEEPERDEREHGKCSPDISSDGLKNVNSEDGLVTKSLTRENGGGKRDLDLEEYILQGAVPKHVIESMRSEGKISIRVACKLDSELVMTFLFVEDRRNSAEERRLIQQLSKDECDEEYLVQQMSMLQLKLDDSRKAIQMERE